MVTTGGPTEGGSKENKPMEKVQLIPSNPIHTTQSKQTEQLPINHCPSLNTSEKEIPTSMANNQLNAVLLKQIKAMINKAINARIAIL